MSRDDDEAHDLLVALMRLWRADRVWMEAIDEGRHDTLNVFGAAQERQFDETLTVLRSALGVARRAQAHDPRDGFGPVAWGVALFVIGWALTFTLLWLKSRGAA